MSNQIAVFIDFENVALWAEQEFLDFELTPLIEYLETRGPVAVKRVYGDWSRFSRYREDLMNNAVDLVQVYSVRAGKNRADIRMALDAFETAVTREQIRTFVIVSGDSDFGPLVNKLREYGRYTLGIGPRDVTHPLLVRACDEFVYLESILEDHETLGQRSGVMRDAARALLDKALKIHEQQGDLPVAAEDVKRTLKLLDPAFSENSLGYRQFDQWLEAQVNSLNLYVRDDELYVAPLDFGQTFNEQEGFHAWRGAEKEEMRRHAQELAGDLLYNTDSLPKPSLRVQYRQIFNRLKMTSVDFATRRDVLRDIYRELSAHPGARTTDDLLEELCRRYESQGLIRSKTTLRQIWQMGFRQRAFDYRGSVASVHVPVWLAEDIQDEAGFVHRAEAGFVFAVVNAGLEIDNAELAAILLNDAEQVDYIQSLLDDLVARDQIGRRQDRYVLPGKSGVPFRDDEHFAAIIVDIEMLQVPETLPRTVEKAQALAKTAMLQRSQDFKASARSYLCACRIQWDAVEQGEASATLEDLRWYIASYASVKAGELSQIERNYAQSRAYYLAFFKLVHEDDPLWSRMRGLINPMLSYFWVNAWRELGLSMENPTSGVTSPAEIAIKAATHENQELCELWFDMTSRLAEINPGLLRRVINQMRLKRGEDAQYGQVADQLEQMLMA